jgi:hypothetical protein
MVQGRVNAAVSSVMEQTLMRQLHFENDISTFGGFKEEAYEKQNKVKTQEEFIYFYDVASGCSYPTNFYLLSDD